MKKLVLAVIFGVFAIFNSNANNFHGMQTDTIPPALEVEGLLQTESFRLLPGAKSGLVLTSDSSGHGSWQPVIKTNVNPNSIGAADLGQNPFKLAISNGHAYVIGSTDDDMKVFDMSQTEPQFLASLSIGSSPRDMAVNDDIVVVLESAFDSLFFIDVSNPAAPFKRSGVRTAPVEFIPQACDVDGTIAGVVGFSSSRLQLFDFSNPDSIVTRGSLIIGGDAREICMSDGYAFIGGKGSVDLKIVDISDPDNPQLTGSVLIGSALVEAYPEKIVVDQGIVYFVSPLTDQIFNVDVSDVTNPVILDTFSLSFNGFMTSLDILNDLLFVGEIVSDAIIALDISNPAELELVGDFPGYPGIRDLVVFDDDICIIDNVVDELSILQLSTGIPSIDIDGNISEFDQKFDGLVEIRSPDLNDHLRLSRAGIGSVDLSISLNKTLAIENGSFFARGLGAKDSNKGFFWGESSSAVSPAIGLVYDGILTGGDNKLHLKEMIEGDTTSLVTFKLDGKVGIGTTDPGAISGLEQAKLQVDSGHVVVSNNFGFLSVNATSDGIGAGIDTEPDDALSFYAGGQSWMTIADTGNIGIGTTTPTSRLEVNGNTSINSTAGNTELLVNTPGTSTSSLKLFEADAFGFEFQYDGAPNVDKLYLRSRGFCCGNEAIRMTWLKNGNVGIGTASPTQTLDVNGNIRSGSGLIFAQEGSQSVSISTNAGAGYVKLDVGGTGHADDHIILGESGTGSLNKIGIGTNSPTELLQVGVSGTGEALSNAWNVFSDRRYKKDIQIMENTLEDITGLNGYYYYSKNAPDGSRKIGVIAQEVEAVFPELVNTNEEGYKSVDYGRLSAVLIEALKEQNEKVVELENENILIQKEMIELKELIYSQLDVKPNSRK